MAKPVLTVMQIKINCSLTNVDHGQTQSRSDIIMLKIIQVQERACQPCGHLISLFVVLLGAADHHQRQSRNTCSAWVQVKPSAGLGSLVSSQARDNHQLVKRQGSSYFCGLCCRPSIGRKNTQAGGGTQKLGTYFVNRKQMKKSETTEINLKRNGDKCWNQST